MYLYYNLYIRNKSFIKKSQYSQWGEDLFIDDFFKNTKSGIYFDIGCFHPFMYSNTCLLHKKGWRGINIDINQTSIDLFNIARPDDCNICTTIDESEKELKYYFDHHFSPLNTADKSFYESSRSRFFKSKITKTIKSKLAPQILNLAGVNKVDFLNIDVEGMDLKILKLLIPQNILPKLISIETHNVEGSKSKDADEISSFLLENKYKLLKRVGPTTLFNN